MTNQKELARIEYDEIRARLNRKDFLFLSLLAQLDVKQRYVTNISTVLKEPYRTTLERKRKLEYLELIELEATTLGYGIDLRKILKLTKKGDKLLEWLTVDIEKEKIMEKRGNG